MVHQQYRLLVIGLACLLCGVVAANGQVPAHLEQQQAPHAQHRVLQATEQPQHKPLVPLSISDFFLLVLTFWVLTIAAGAGIGGGTLLVPLLAILSDFSMLEVVALSNVTIFAGTVTNILFNLPRKNPCGTGPVIDYDLLLLFGSTIVAGSVIGSHANYFVPSWVSKVLVVLVMLPMAVRTVDKARRTWQNESRKRRQQAAQAKQQALAGKDATQEQPCVARPVSALHRPCSAAAAAQASLLRQDREALAVSFPQDREITVTFADGAAEGLHRPCSAAAAAELEMQHQPAAPASCVSGDDLSPDAAAAGSYDLWQRPKSVIGANSRSLGANTEAELLPRDAVTKCRRLDHKHCVHTYALDDKMEGVMLRHAAAQKHLLTLAAMMLMVLLASISSHFLVTCGTWQYWLLSLSPIPVMCLVWAAVRWHVLWCVGWRECLGLENKGDIDWTPRTTLLYPATCTGIGTLAGLLGLGGGTFMTPMLLELGVHPSVAAASSQAATQIGTFSASVVYLVNHSVPTDYGLAMVVMALAGALHGQLVINYLIGRTNRPSIVILALAVLFIAGVGMAAAVAGMAVADVVRHPEKLTMTNAANLCRRHSHSHSR